MLSKEVIATKLNGLDAGIFSDGWTLPRLSFPPQNMIQGHDDLDNFPLCDPRLYLNLQDHALVYLYNYKRYAEGPLTEQTKSSLFPNGWRALTYLSTIWGCCWIYSSTSSFVYLKYWLHDWKGLFAWLGPVTLQNVIFDRWSQTFQLQN